MPPAADTVPVMTAKSTSADRMRRHRARKRRGAVRIALDISPEGIRELARLGWLATGGRDPRAVARAVLGIASKAAILELRSLAPMAKETHLTIV